MIILGDTEKYIYEDEFDDSYYYNNDEYEYDEFGGWFKKIRKKITPKRILKGFFMPHKLLFMPHKLISKTPLGKITKGIKNTVKSAIGIRRRPKRRRFPQQMLVKPARPIRRTPVKVIPRPNLSAKRNVRANQMLNQAPTKGVTQENDTKSKPKKEGLSTVAVVGIVAGGVAVLLGGAYLMTRNKSVIVSNPAPVAPTV